MKNQQLRDIFEQMADVMEILGEDRFRVNTYRKVARVISDCPKDVATLAAEGKLQELPGVGKSSAVKINEFVHAGAIKAHRELLARIPPGLLDMLRISGFGPKGVAAVWKHLKVETLADLQRVIEDKSLEGLPGFGAKKAEGIARGIQFIESAGHRILLAHALALSDLIVGQLQNCKGLQEIELAGSLRRGCETVGDIDILVQAKDGEEIIETFTKLPGVQRVLGAGETKASIQFAEPELCSDVVQVDLRIVPVESFGAAWQYFTGSKYHNVKLRAIAGAKKYKLNEYGLFRGDKQIAGETEAEIYQKLGLQYIAPTLREDRGEIELSQQNQLPAIVELKDIQGDLHMHSPASDGLSELEELVQTARQLGYTYIAISDHSKSSVIANGLDVKRLQASIKKVRKLNESLKNFTVLISSEVDILLDGSLDYPDEVLAELDFVVASVHSGLKGSKERSTTRLLKAMENPYVNCIGHPTGRMIHVREPMELDMDAIVKQAAGTGTAMEVSASPLRLDLNDIHCRQAIEAGVKLVINTDAHDIHGLGQMRYGVATAQRGWASKADVLNAQPVGAIRKWVKQKRLGKLSTTKGLTEKIDYFKRPDEIISLGDIIEDKKILPNEKGIYGWYFKKLPPQVPNREYFGYGQWKLLYIGIAGKTKESKGTLYSRIFKKHINGNADISTLRKTLGPILRKELGLMPYKKGSGEYRSFWFGKEGENILRDWLIAHARITWVKDDQPRKVEQTFIDLYGHILPLNIDNNKRNPIGKDLMRLRKQCLDEAWGIL